MASFDSTRGVPVSGWNACLALFGARPGDIRKIYIVQRKTKALGHVLKWAASRHLAYNVVDAPAMEKIAGTRHHEGIVFIAEEKPVQPAEDLLSAPAAADSLVLALENVGNPHNLGAIFRTAGFFGVTSVILMGPDSPKRLSPAILRTAQGGVEGVSVFRSEAPLPIFRQLKGKGYTLVGTDVFGRSVDVEGPAAGPTVLIMGSEGTGMSPEVRTICDRLLKIQGSGRVESLNVSVACGVFVALLKNAHQSPKA